MKNINFGKIKKYVISNTTKNLLENEEKGEIGIDLNNFLNLVMNSEILMKENEIFKNLSKKGLFENENVAHRFIKTNFDKIHKNFSVSEVISEHQKLEKFNYSEFSLSENEEKIFSIINTIIEEGIGYSATESMKGYEIILNNLLSETIEEKIETEVESLDEAVIEKAIEIFNDTYKLSESDSNLFNIITEGTDNEKETLLETTKKNIINILESTNYEHSKIEKTIKKLNETIYNKNTFDKEIIKLVNLKDNLS